MHRHFHSLDTKRHPIDISLLKTQRLNSDEETAIHSRRFRDWWSNVDSEAVACVYWLEAVCMGWNTTYDSSGNKSSQSTSVGRFSFSIRQEKTIQVAGPTNNELWNCIVGRKNWRSRRFRITAGHTLLLQESSNWQYLRSIRYEINNWRRGLYKRNLYLSSYWLNFVWQGSFFHSGQHVPPKTSTMGPKGQGLHCPSFDLLDSDVLQSVCLLLSPSSSEKDLCTSDCRWNTGFRLLPSPQSTTRSCLRVFLCLSHTGTNEYDDC